MPAEIDQIVFVNSGSEANDLAWQMATNWTRNTGAIVSEYAYHGITGATKELSPKYWPNGKKPKHLETITPPTNSTEHRYEASDSVDEVAAAIDRQEANKCGTATFVFDSLFTSDGVFPPNREKLEAVLEQVRNAGGVSIVDEVQAGFGRTGDDMWGFQNAGITPDIVTLGKPMGNGYPVAAVGGRSEIIESFRESAGMFSTYGGNPVASAAALATVEEIMERDLLTHASEVSAYMGSQLAALASEHNLIGEVRQEGLMCGIELVQSRQTWEPACKKAKDIINYLRQHQILIGLTGAESNVLKIRPPLIFEQKHVDQLVEGLDTALSEVSDVTV
jgi:4-aminobutyrate aminotransferase-like enzyme